MPLTTPTNTNLGGTLASFGVFAGLLAGVATIAGCGNGLSDIDRRIDRVLAERSGQLDGGTVAPERTWPKPDLPPLRDLATWEPSSVNPPAGQLPYKPADEKRDFAKRLDQLQRESVGAESDDALKLDLPECWRQSQKTAREYLTAQEDYITAGIRLLIERHRWSIRLFANVAADFTAGQIDGDSATALAVINQLGARKQLPFGGEVAARWVWSATENLRYAATNQYVQSSRIVLDGNVPLLRGFGLVAEESRIQGERDLVYAARDFESFRRDFLVSVARDYFNLLQQRDNVVSTERQVVSLRQIRDRQQALYDAGRVAKFEVALAANDVLNAEAGLANAKELLLLSVDRFRVRLGLPEGTHIRIEPSEFVLPEPDVALDTAVGMALDYRLDLQNRRDRLDDTKRSVLIAANQLLPDLNVRGGVGFPTDSSTREGGFIYELDDIQYNAGFTFDLPLDKEAERLALRQSVISLGQAQRSLDQFRDELVIDVRARVREIERARFNLQLAEDRVQINLRRKEEQEIKADEVDAQAQLDTANAIRESERARDQAKTDVRNAVLDYLLSTGTMRVQPSGVFQPLPGMESAPTPDLPPDAPILVPPAEPDSMRKEEVP